MATVDWLGAGDPNWAPLEAVQSPEQMGDWMWMGRLRAGEQVIEQYKHIDTRRYLSLDATGQAYDVRYYVDRPEGAPPEIDPVPLADAIKHATT